MSPLAKYVTRNLGTRPFVTSLVVSYMLVVGLTIGGVIATSAGLRAAFSPKGNEKWVLVLGRNAEDEKDSVLTNSVINAVSVNPEVKHYSPEAVTTNAGLLVLRGLEPQGFELHGMRLLEGRKPDLGRDEIIVGKALLELRPDLRIGATIHLITRDFTVVGTFSADDHYEGEAWTTRAKFLSEPNWNALAVILVETEGAAEASALAARLKSSRALDVNAMTERQLFDKMLGEYDHIALGLSVLFLFVVVGAVLAAASLLAVLQQRRLPELCVMRAMGFRDAAIARLIFYETMLLVMMGGCVGLAIATLACRHMSFQVVSLSLSSITFHVALTWAYAAVTVVLLFLIGAFSAMVPIARMRRTSITSGLREE
jgi:ABC-type lipoprotein release transport system permease subunit